MDRTMARFAIVLGVLSAAGPLAIDMYLPALPNIARDLGASQGLVEMSMMTFFAGLMAGQPFYGPLSDRFGRKPPMLWGILLYVLASVVCSIASNAPMLVVARLAQGLGAGSAIAISAAIIRDMYSGHQAARLIALRMLVLGASPIVAPMLGAMVIAVASWRYVFWLGAGVGVVGCLLLFLIPETRHAEHRTTIKISAVFGVYKRLFADPTFLGAVAAVAFMQLAFAGYIAGASFVFIKLNHVSPQIFGLIFGFNAVGVIACAQFAPNLMKRFKAEQLILTGIGIQASMALAILVLAVTGHATTTLLLGPLFLFLACYGLVGGPAVVLALRDHAPVAGTAASLLSFLQWGSAALGSGLTAALADGSARPMTEVMAVAATTGCIVVVLALGGRAVAPAAV